MANSIKALQAALKFQQRGEHAKAARLLRQVLAIDAKHPDALHLLGLCLHAQGDNVEALKQIRKAIEVTPSEPMFHTNAGVVAVAMGDVKSGITHYRRALELDPNYADACNNLGVALQGIGLFSEAATAFRRAVELRPDAPGALVNLGNALRLLGQPADAIGQYRRALAIAPDLAEAHNNLGNALKSLRRYAAAIESYDKALTLRPDFSEAHFNRGLALAIRGDPEGAVEALTRAMAIRPDPRYRLARAGILPVIPRSLSDMAEWRERFAREIAALACEKITVPGTPLETPVMNFYLAYHGENDRDLMVQLSRLYRQAYPWLEWTAPHCGGGTTREPGRRIRLGFFSAFLYDHAVAWSIRGFLEALPKERFEVILFTVRQPEGNVMPEIAAVADSVVMLPHSVERARGLIAEACLDVLTYADIGMESLSYALAHARLAPVQCATWGHPVTTGISTMDYYISSDFAEPDDAADQYSERLVRLAGIQSCYRRPAFPADPGPPPAPDLPPGATIYLCPQSLFKIHPDMDRPLSEILRRDPTAVMLFFEGTDKVITDRLQARWREPFADVAGRMRFLPRVPVERFLGIMASADVLLDTWPFGSGNTSYQGFAAGIPIVTLPGKYLRGRGTLAHYRHMGFTDCVADSPQSYVDIAVRLGIDRDFHRRITAMIRERCHVLFDDKRVGADLVRFLLEVTA
jgi:protein O-GlcNAc transferase